MIRINWHRIGWVLGIALLAASCGSGDGSSSDGTSDEQTATEVSVDTSIFTATQTETAVGTGTDTETETITQTSVITQTETETETETQTSQEDEDFNLPTEDEEEVTFDPPEDMVLISAIFSESFVMGSQEIDDAQPEHRVLLTEDYYISEDEVTVAEYRSFVEATGYAEPVTNCIGTPIWQQSEVESHPVNCVSWDDTQEFIDWKNEEVSNSQGLEYRLCTEAEWEMAARASSTGHWSCGSDPICVPDVAWYLDNSEGVTQAVQGKTANDWGLYDVHGNVSEWVQDWYQTDYYEESPESNPTGPATGVLKVHRGGHYHISEDGLRSAMRFSSAPGSRLAEIGFRLCASVIEIDPAENPRQLN